VRRHERYHARSIPAIVLAKGAPVRLTKHDPGTGGPYESTLFDGPVTRQEIVTDDDAELLRVNSITFHDGARNLLHHHACDQVLVVTHGRGIVATEAEQLPVEPGDIVLISAGERHWHGARPGETMTHLSILTPGPITRDA
jgi:quercetin dioxygenase-like cupin family protein